MITIIAEYKDGHTANIRITEIADANQIFTILDNEPTCVRLRMLKDSYDITDSRYDQE